MSFITNVNAQQSSLTIKETDEIKNIQSRIKTISSEIEKIFNEISELKTKTNTVIEETNIMGGSIVELNRKLERANNEILNLMVKIESITRDISELKVQQFASSEQKLIKDESEVFAKVSSSEIEKLSTEINNLKQEIKLLKENLVSDNLAVKDPNMRRILTSPYLTITSVLISIIALISVF